MRQQKKEIFKRVVQVAYKMIAIPFILVAYLYEKLLNYLWPDPYDCEDDDLE